MDEVLANQNTQPELMDRVKFNRKTTRRNACLLSNNKKEEQSADSLIDIGELMNFEDKDSLSEIPEGEHDTTCNICLAKVSCITFNPCLHKCACAKCSIKILRYQKKCPLCRKEVDSYSLDKVE